MCRNLQKWGHRCRNGDTDAEMGTQMQKWGHRCRNGDALQKWGRTAEMGTHCRNGDALQKWGHTAEMGTHCRNGDTLQKWGHTWAADVAGGGDLASAVMISGKILLWVARTLRAGAKFVRVCFTRGPWLSWLERSVHIRKVTGSSPVGPIPASGKFANTFADPRKIPCFSGVFRLGFFGLLSSADVFGSVCGSVCGSVAARWKCSSLNCR
ncbi:MAG: hypothetical protein RIT02_3069 [Planctomycetota bacterium]